MLLIIAMVFSSSISVYADEVSDNTGVSDNNAVMPGAGAAVETPAAGETGSGDEIVPDEGEPVTDEPASDETVSDNEDKEPVSEDGILPEEEGDEVPEEAAGDDTPEGRLVERIKNASSGEVIKLTENVTLTKVLEIGGGKNITIDLSGNKISGNGSTIPVLYAPINTASSKNMGNKFLISVSGQNTKVTLKDSAGTGSIDTDATGMESDSIVAVWDGASIIAEDITLKPYIDKAPHCGGNSMERGAKAIMVVGNVSDPVNAAGYKEKAAVTTKATLTSVKIPDTYIGVYAIGKGATVVVNSGVEISANNAAIQNQGQLPYFGTDITVNGGRLYGKDTDGNAIYHPGYGTLRINGGELYGTTAVEMSNGNVQIDGSNIMLKATKDFADNVNIGMIANGSTTTGCGMCYSPYSEYGLDGSLDIRSGSFSGIYGLFINYRSGSDDYLKEHVKINIQNGTFDRIGKHNSFPDNVAKEVVSLTGGRFKVAPVAPFLADGYGTTSEDGYYKVIKLTRAYIRPVIAQAVVYKGQSLSQAGLGVALIDGNGNKIAGTTVTGAAFDDLMPDGTVSNADIDITESCNKIGTYYLAAKQATGFNISQNGADMTDYYVIVPHTTPISANLILKYTVEEVKQEDVISIVPKKDIYYSYKIDNVYDYFAVYFTHDGVRQELTKASGVKFYWNGESTPSDSFDCSQMDAGVDIPLTIEYLEKKSATSFMIQRLPVFIEGATPVSSLVGDELTERYYGLIKVYGPDEDGNMDPSYGISVNDVRMEYWFDCTSSVIDLSGISNTRKGTYKAVLRDAAKLKEEKAKNYELMQKASVTYNVEPSLIIDFREPSRESELAPTKIRRAGDKTPLIIYNFANKRKTVSASWCVKNVSYNKVERCWYEEMKDAKEIGIDYSTTANEMGTKFEFTQDFMTLVSENGARYTLYEIFKEDMTYTDESNHSLTVKAVAPVVYNGNKFVASDDTRYYSRGIPKSGYSPTLKISVWDGPAKLSFGTDYTLTYKNNKNAGSEDSDKVPTVVVTGKGIYSTMKITVMFTILAADLSHAANVAVTSQYIKYNGKNLKPKVKAVYRSGVNAGKEIPASAYDITVFDEEKRDVTEKKYTKSSPYARYTVVLTANGSNPNISGSISEVVTDTDENGNEERSEIFFYGIPKNTRKMTVTGTYKKVAYPLGEDAEGLKAFLDADKFCAKTTEKKYYYQDITEGTISVDLVDGKDECTATVYDVTNNRLDDSGIYYLKVQFATDDLKIRYYVFEPVYVKVTYAGTKLKTSDIKLKKKSFDFSSSQETTPLTLKLSKRLINKGTEGIKLYIYQTGKTMDVSELAEAEYEIPGSELENNKAGRYRIRVEGLGAYYGGYDLTYTIGVQAYDKEKTPVKAFVNAVSGDETENPVPYRPDGKYPDDLVKVVWTQTNGEKVVLQQRTVSGSNAGEGDYYIQWGTFKQVGPKKGSVTIVGTGTYFTGKFKKKFDVTQAE